MEIHRHSSGPGDAGTASPRRHRAATLLIVAWLAWQIALPARALFEPRSDGAGRFSWNMYASRYACRVGYTYRPTDGPAFVVDHEALFNDLRRARRVLHRDALSAFHAWLCDRLQHETPGTLEGIVACTTDGGPSELLVEPGTDLCAAVAVP